MTQRMKFPDDPEKFMDSEVDLDEALQDLFQFVNAPQFYPIVVETNTLQNLLHLFQHENKDLTTDMIQLLASLTDTTDNEEHASSFRLLVSKLIELDVVKSLIELLISLAEASDDEASVIFHILTTLDNMMDVMPDVTNMAAKNRQVERPIVLLKRMS